MPGDVWECDGEGMKTRAWHEWRLETRLQLARLTVFALVAAGCVSDRILSAGAVEASGVAGQRELRIGQVSFDLERNPADTLPVFCVRLAPDAAPIRADALTPSLAAAILAPWQPPSELSDAYFRVWPASDPRTHRMFIGNGYWMSFRDERLVALSAKDATGDNVMPGQPSDIGASVGPASCERLYPLPIDRSQFVEIFGAPDRERNMTRY